MILKMGYFSISNLLAIAVTWMIAFSAQGAETPKDEKIHNPWTVNLSLYTWLPGVSGEFSVGPYSKSVDASFIDIAGKLRNFPLAFNGRFEAHYDKLGFYLDGNYMQMDFKPRFDRISSGVSSEIGIMDYGLMYRVYGPSASERVANWNKQSRSSFLDIYTAGRSIWLGNQIDAIQVGSVSGSKSFFAPLLGGRVLVEFTSSWFALVDGNAGGFGVDNVDFTGSVLGAIGYRTRLFGVPTSVEAGYKALRVKIVKDTLATDVTLNGPFIGLTGYW
jgi:hypothetical protein